MKQLLLILIIATTLNTLHAQRVHHYFGFGYFGETLTHTGGTLEYCYDKYVSRRFSFPFKSSIGFYAHPRNHNALFIQAKAGTKWHFNRRFYIGVNGGIGPMLSWYNSDLGVFEVDENNQITEVTNFAGIDLMPSADVNIGFKLSPYKKSENQHIWLRPTVFWQMAVNEKNLLHIALAIGYSIEIF